MERARTARASGAGPARAALSSTSGDGDHGLTRAQQREIERRERDLRDPTRYLIVSRMGPGFALYFDVTDGTFALNDPNGGTLFKRRDAAIAVSRTLHGRVEVIRCSSRVRAGRRVAVVKPGAKRTRATPR